ncbi:MAG: carboxylesterase [Gammaproteobacteria bacterium]|nr:carboxylesterase [Gammaproteobacteria bacterium]
MTTPLTSIEIEQNKPISNSIIWLHGLGADGSDFISIVPELHLPSSLGIRFIFPHAPIMPVTINQGFEMRAWFDIYGTTRDSKIDFPGIQQSVEQINQLIEKEIERGIKPEQIIVCGFSQGATIALMTGLFHSQPLGGVIALSGYLPTDEQTFQKVSPVNRNLSIFLAHGTEDLIVPYALGKATYAALRNANYPVSWHSYPIPHSVCAEEINAISQWMQKMLQTQR